ncbi:MAG: SRPBCC family protein [Actinomycetota bacterium]
MAKLTPQPPEWIHSAPFQASATRELDASPDEVFTALCDHENWPEWFETIERVERFGDLNEGLGSNRRVHINSRLSVDEEFIVWEPGEAWGFTIVSATVGGLKAMNELVTIEDLGADRSRVTYKMGIAPKFPISIFMKVARKIVEKSLRDALDNLGPYIANARKKA